MIGAMLFFSGFLFIMVQVFSQTLHLQIWKKHQHQCRKQVFLAQKHLQRTYKKLLQMNPQAKRLRFEYKMAKRALKAAKTPSSFAAASAYFTAVKARQLIFKARQQALIQSGKFKAYKSLKALGSKYKFDKVPFVLVAQPKKSMSPSYKIPHLGLRHKQRIQVQWKNQETKNQSGFNPTYKGTCAASMQKKMFQQSLQVKFDHSREFSL